MTTLPIHTVQHIKSVYKKYQIVAIVFTAITILAALLAAISGFQFAKLRKIRAAEVQTPPAAVVPAPVPAEEKGLEKQIKVLEDQLHSEKDISRELRTKIHDLEKKIASMKSASSPPAHTAPVKPKATLGNHAATHGGR